ncbi:type II secretion system F family protein [Panacagrimonas perspica]|nr:type II secretion system F family protein [Panacagrimonas perspica]
MAALACALVFAALLGFRRVLPAQDRVYMDPLPVSLRLLWPLVSFFSYYFSRFCTIDYLERVQGQLVRAGMNYRMNAEQFVALRIVSALAFTLAFTGALSWVGDSSIACGMIALAFGYSAPYLKLRDRRRRRERSIARLLPTYLDFITMALEAGLSLSSALVQATVNGPRGLLSQEFERVTRDITAGAGRIEALDAMSARLDMPQVTCVIAAIAQADRSGGSIGSTLRVQAEQQRVDRFQRAERLAMEAPVKLIFPLVAFIFPTTFIILGFPIAMKMLHHV